MNFVEELKWRGMIQDIMPGTEELLKKGKTSGYIGFDPTADSLHIGHMVQVMLLVHFQRSGHTPIALVGGATGMIGDPSGKSEERNLLDEASLRKNQEAIKKQLSRFLDFQSDNENRAVMVNNYDWMKEYSFLGFIRDIGKHITVNYMMSKDSVKKRIGSKAKEGMSFTEFSYQLVQGTDFLYLFNNFNCKLQMGGSDQWGNIVTGTELIRRKAGGEAFALTCPLITKSDGTKFGKTESGNVWLDPEKTTPYQFYQFWLNISDEDAAKYIKIFTVLPQGEIENIVSEHNKAPHERILQKRLAEEVTVMVHSRDEYEGAVEASQILFGKGTTESLKKMSENTFLSVFESAPVVELNREFLTPDVSIGDICSVYTNIFPSKSELKRLVQQGGFSINKEKVNDIEQKVNSDMLLNNKYMLLQKGKKNFTLIRFKDSFKEFIIFVDQWKELDKSLKELYLKKKIFVFYNSDKEYLHCAYEEIETLWYKQFAKAYPINYVMLSEAPLWGDKRNYIYNPNSNYTQFFYREDLEAVLNRPIPNKEIFIEELTRLGLIVLDVLPFALNENKTKLTYNQFSVSEYRQLIESTSKFHLEKKIGIIRKRSSNPNVFFRYKNVKVACDKIIKSKLTIINYDLPYISKQGGGIDHEKLIKLIHP
jgi:tyrosyl-tRNA synthetase